MELLNVFTKQTETQQTHELITYKEHTDEFILSIPHSGLLIPTAFTDRYKIDDRMLTNTDMHTDVVYGMQRGIRVLTKLSPFFVDVARFEHGDPTGPVHMQKDPFHRDFLTGGMALQQEHSENEIRRLLAHYHRYHHLLDKAIKHMKAKHGFALVFDCHSMLSHALSNTVDAGEERSEFVVGTRDDTSAHHDLIRIFVHALQEQVADKSYRVAKNHPYKGGYITQTYGKPENHVHVLQLEVVKKLYMDEGQHVDPEAFQLRKKHARELTSILKKAFLQTFKAAKRIHNKL